MNQSTLARTSILKTLSQADFLADWLEAFLLDRKTQNFSPHTLAFYRQELKRFLAFCEGRAINQVGQITANDLRGFLLWLEETGHNPGSVNIGFRAVRAFLRWYEREAEPDGWKNPVEKVKNPKVAIEPLQPVDLGDVRKLLKACGAGDFLGLRDVAIFRALLDTGARAAEFLALNLEDVDMVTGAILIRQGKGRKPRNVYLGKAARKALKRYLQGRGDDNPALWVTDDGARMKYGGLRGMVARRAAQAGIEPPELHSFRRAFALDCLRAGMDIYTLQKLMGHADLQVLRRYLAQNDADLREAHGKFSPGDRL